MAAIATSTAPVAAAVTVRPHYLEWGPVILGALGATAISVVLLTFGAALGLSIVSPYPYAGISAKGLAVLTGTYVALVTVASFGAGGYLAGRLRSPWAGAVGNEVTESHFRDGSHGFGVWALGVVLGAALAVSGVGGILKTAVHGTTAIAAAGTAGAASNPAAGAALNRLSMEPTDFAVDHVLAPTPAPAGAAATAPSSRADLAAPVARVFAANLANPQLNAADRTYLVQLVMQQTGLPQADAEKRVDSRFHRTQGRRTEGARSGRAGAQGHPHRGVPGRGDSRHRLRRRVRRRRAGRTPSRRQHPGRVLGFAPLLVTADRQDEARLQCSRAFSCLVTDRQALGGQRSRRTRDRIRVSSDRVGTAGQLSRIVDGRIRPGCQGARMMEDRIRPAEDLGRLVADGIDVLGHASPRLAGKLRDGLVVGEAAYAFARRGQALVQFVHYELATDAQSHVVRLHAGCDCAVGEDGLLGRELVAACAERRSPEILRIGGDASGEPLRLRRQGRHADAGRDGARVAPIALGALCDLQPERRQLHPAHAEGGASQTLVHGDAVGDTPLIVGHHLYDPALGELVDVDIRACFDAGRGGGGGIGARDRTAGRRHGQEPGSDRQDWERQYTIYAHESPPRWGDPGLDPQRPSQCGNYHTMEDAGDWVAVACRPCHTAP